MIASSAWFGSGLGIWRRSQQCGVGILQTYLAIFFVVGVKSLLLKETFVRFFPQRTGKISVSLIGGKSQENVRGVREPREHVFHTSALPEGMHVIKLKFRPQFANFFFEVLIGCY
jgi:hypothetical protein